MRGCDLRAALIAAGLGLFAAVPAGAERAAVPGSEVVAYRVGAEGPASLPALFDPAILPGRRAVVWPPVGLYAQALVAAGTPERQVRDLLSSPRGVAVAGRRVAPILPYIIWCADPAEALQRLAAGEVAVALVDGADFAAAREPGLHLLPGASGWARASGAAGSPGLAVWEDAVARLIAADLSPLRPGPRAPLPLLAAQADTP